MKATKKNYAALHDNPYLLFPGGPDDQGVRVRLWPNGKNAIWLSDDTGTHSVEITASMGPSGLGIVIRHHVGANSLTVRPFDEEYNDACPRLDGIKEVGIVSYNTDEKSQAFKKWYDGQATEEECMLLGKEFVRKEVPDEFDRRVTEYLALPTEKLTLETLRILTDFPSIECCPVDEEKSFSPETFTRRRVGVLPDGREMVFFRRGGS